MNAYRSSETNLISESLSKAQGSYKVLNPNQDGPCGMFATLSGILSAVKESLASNGLSFYQYIELQDEGMGASILRSVLSHSSGQFISSCARVAQEDFLKIEEYKRMHAYMLLGIAPVGNDPLLEGEHDVIEKMAATKPRSPSYIRPSMGNSSLTTDEYNELVWELEDYPEIAKSILKYYNISTIADLPRQEYYPARMQIKKIKKAHEDFKRD